MVVETHSAASVCAMVRAGAGVSIVNPLTALDYAASGVTVRRFSIDVPFTVSLIRPLHRPPPRWLTPSVSIYKRIFRAGRTAGGYSGADDESIKLTASAA